LVDQVKMTRELDEIIINFLNLNKGNAFIPDSLLKRIKNDIQDPDISEYLKNNIEGVLNKLAFSYKIDMHEHEGKMYFMKLHNLEIE